MMSTWSLSCHWFSLLFKMIVFMADLVLGRRLNSKQAAEKTEKRPLVGDAGNASEKQASDEDAAGSVMRRKVKASTD